MKPPKIPNTKPSIYMFLMRDEKEERKKQARSCVKGPFNLNGRNGRTTAGVDLHRTRDQSAHTVVSN